MDTPKGPEEGSASVCAGWPSKQLPPHMELLLARNTASWSRAVSLGTSLNLPTFPSTPINQFCWDWREPRHQGDTMEGVTWKTKDRENGKVILPWKGLRGKPKPKVFLEKWGELENLSSIVNPPSWSSALVNRESTWCFVLDYILSSETAREVSETCNCLATLKGSI